MKNRYLTLNDLYEFCKKNNFTRFSSKETGSSIVVQSFGKFSIDNYDDSDLTPVTLQACHTELNNNNSYISESTMKKALPSFSNKPILGYIHQLDDGTWDFYTHNISYIRDDNTENGMRTEYDERVVGIVPESCSAHLEYDKDKDKNYVVVNGYIYNLYGNRAIDIIKNNNGQATVSVEIEVREMNYNVEKDYLEIEDMAFLGVTCLGKNPDGTPVLPGMEGANLRLDSFSEKNNSMFSADYQTKLIETLENLNNTLSTLTINSIQNKEVFSNMNHFEELLQKYEVTVEECDFDYTNMTDEELDAKFEEVFGCKKKKKCDADESEKEEIIEVEESTEDIDESEAEEDYAGCKKKKKCSTEDSEIEEDIDEDYAGCKKKKKCDINDEECEGECNEQYALINFRISHDDIRFGIQSLLNEMNSELHYYVVNSVYDNYFYYEDWYDGKAFKQDYKMRKDNISFSGEPIPVFREFVTQAEKDELENMRKNYALLKEFKEQYDAAQLQAEKDTILSDACYDEIRASEEFKDLVSKSIEFSAEEIRTKAELIFAAAMKKKFNFSNNSEAKHSVKTNINAKPAKKTYAGLFDD